MRSLLGLLLSFAIIGPVSLAQDFIPWNEAANFYGQLKTVEGTVIATKNTGKVCFLNFSQAWRTDFTAVIFGADFQKFPKDPELYYRNRKVRVTGKIQKYKGKPEIIVRSPRQIEILEGNTRAPLDIQTPLTPTAPPPGNWDLVNGFSLKKTLAGTMFSPRPFEQPPAMHTAQLQQAPAHNRDLAGLRDIGPTSAPVPGAQRPAAPVYPPIQYPEPPRYEEPPPPPKSKLKFALMSMIPGFAQGYEESRSRLNADIEARNRLAFEVYKQQLETAQAREAQRSMMMRFQDSLEERRNVVAAEAKATTPQSRAREQVTPRSGVGGCEAGHWIESVAGDGQIIKLEDGSLWKVDDIDTVTSMIWLPVSDVLLCGIKMINVDDAESVAVTRLAPVPTDPTSPVQPAARNYVIQASANDETFVINDEVFKAKTYCFNLNKGDRVIFIGGSPTGACASARLLNVRTGKTCDVWCE